VKRLKDYTEFVDDEIMEEICAKARELQGIRVTHINSTSQGGGVAEILNSLIPLMNDIGINADWRVINGNHNFFTLTKGFHNALQGGEIELDNMQEQLYMQVNESFSSKNSIDADIVVVHDPQPLPLIKFYEKKQPWVWRCHVDLSCPNETLWKYLSQFIMDYDTVIVSNDTYRKTDLPIEQRVIYPAIDPLTSKNMWLSEAEILGQIQSAGIPTDKPVITQVSRMDRWKDPEGLLEVFQSIREIVDCRMLYCYSSSVDDPEGFEIFTKTYDKAQRIPQGGDVLFVEGTNQLLVNALQRFSNVIMQKSIKEGFCLCITEALWKERPVVATNVGGIPTQLREAENGFLVEASDTDRFASKVSELLQNPDLSQRMGQNGKEVVRNNFLITRFILDCLNLYNDLISCRN
jgi:trehalose synthase